MIYLDHAATTAVDKRVLQKMLPYFCEHYGNPGSGHRMGHEAATAVYNSRKQLASAIGCDANEIFFTSGGSESDTWALESMAYSFASKGRHIITSSIEHPAILQTCHFLAKQGYEITFIDPDEGGFISAERIEKAIRNDTILVSIMSANNEIGTIQPLAEIGKVCRSKKVFFHTDAVQAFGHMKMDVNSMKIDMLSASSHKFYGPKGVGFLYISSRIQDKLLMASSNVMPLIHGGGQEMGLRSGTENVPGIVGMGEAAELATRNMQTESEYLQELSGFLLDKLETEFKISINGSMENRLPGNLNVSFEGLNGEKLRILLDMKGICVSNGSACKEGQNTSSHVLKAIGKTDAMAKGAIRFSLGRENTRQDIIEVINTLKNVMEEL
ncbi:cysteine desulfurase family protein [Butyrivibrio sp. NC3005]|uniref:cysteine desulfurase family protein n=1 Tax=Butyrivibrio sp. NC3005 TaxID=1280685 RepID=UPI0003F9BE98|nr:cysteine desulfurase family protein [Butyrivibrio sp. NC3005]